MSTILSHFDALARCGLRIIPLRSNSKVPLCKAWNEGWDQEKNRHQLTVHPDSNIGLLLGDIVDVEGDSVEANNIVSHLIGDYPHPAYQSLKSVHHLFQTPDPDLSHFRVGEIEFRGKGHQSVLPPSQHAGVRYQWLKKFTYPIPPMPDRLIEFYFEQKTGKKWRTIKPGHLKIRCFRCEKPTYLHRRRHELETVVFRSLGRRWECRSCRGIDLRPACRLVKSGQPNKVAGLFATE